MATTKSHSPSRATPVYLDYAAATPMDSRVTETMEPYFSRQFYNPSAPYLRAKAVAASLLEARQTIAGHLGARPSEIIFTAGATEANNMAIAGIMENYPQAEVLLSSIEHDSVLLPAKRYKHTLLPVHRSGVLDLEAASRAITDTTVLLSVMLVNNELGTLQPVRELGRLVARVRRQRTAAGNELPLLLHTDAAQAPNFLDIHFSRLGADMVSLNGGKIYGPKQSGVLMARAGVRLKPLIVGGGQEGGMRSGTENVAAAIGLAKALTIAQEAKKTESERLAGLRKMLIDGVKPIEGVTQNGDARRSAPHIVNLSFEGRDNEKLMMQLDELGIMCATGSACSANTGQSSHVLRAIGCSEQQIQGSLRFSLGRQTRPSDIEAVIAQLRRLAG